MYATCYGIRACLRVVILLLFAFASHAFAAGTGRRAADEVYGGIALTTDGIEAIALRVSGNEEDAGVKLIFSDNIPLPLRRSGAGKFAPQISATVSQEVLKVLTRFRQEFRVPAEHTYLIGDSRLKADYPEDLVSTIRGKTGLTLNFLDATTEIQLRIAGTIPRIVKSGTARIDNRNSSVLIDLGNTGTLCGYEFLKHPPAEPSTFDFASMSMPWGPVSYASEAGQSIKENSDNAVFLQYLRDKGAPLLRAALQRETETRPGLIYRSRVFLSGPFIEAVATLSNPEDRQSFVPLTYDEIALFAEKAARSPQLLTNPNLSTIKDPKLRKEIEEDVEVIRNSFTPRQLIAGAELLKIMADELKWREKKLWFARIGKLGCLLSYVRLQAGR